MIDELGGVDAAEKGDSKQEPKQRTRGDDMGRLTQRQILDEENLGRVHIHIRPGLRGSEDNCTEAGNPKHGTR